MADANKVIEKLSLMLASAQRELAISLVEIEEMQSERTQAAVDAVEEEKT